MLTEFDFHVTQLRYIDHAVISKAESKLAGTPHLEFDAPHGTSFDVFQRVSTDANFTQVADDGIEQTYDATGLKTDLNYDLRLLGATPSTQAAKATLPPSR